LLADWAGTRLPIEVARHCAVEIPAPRQVATATVGQFIAEYAAAVRIFATPRCL
jgi:hypothetical protein